MKQENLNVTIVLNGFMAIPTREDILKTLKRDIETDSDIQVYINDTEQVKVTWEVVIE